MDYMQYKLYPYIKLSPSCYEKTNIRPVGTAYQ